MVDRLALKRPLSSAAGLSPEIDSGEIPFPDPDPGRADGSPYTDYWPLPRVAVLHFFLIW